ncbi:hypothetical protein C8R43DRAFT_1133993 [Mycena crocata]|nr:hypothetical protein C8R43DRAFT_1133993 [Mycena crocata]
MVRATRSGVQFSPYELDSIEVDGRKCGIIRTSTSLDGLLREALAAADLREAYLDAAADLGEAAGEDDEWEDVDLLSEPPSPLSSAPSSPLSSAPSSRAPSPSIAQPRPSPSCNTSPSLPASYSSTLHIPASSSSMIPPPGRAEAQRKNKGASARRRVRNAERKARSTPYDRGPDLRYPQEYREQPSHSVEFDAEDLPKSGGGAWIGKRSKGSQRFYTPAELEEEGYEYVEWNGRDPKLILDCEGRIIAVLLGTPDDPEWTDNARVSGSPRDTGGGNISPLRRGSVLVGAKGLQHPGNLRNNRRIRRLLRRLLRNRSIRRIMGFQSSGFAMYAPKLYRYYCWVLKALFQHQPELIHLFTNSIFPAATFNCGPDAFSFDHCDFNNAPNGFCGVTSGGHFNHKRGGHMYLKQIRLVIEFPSGASMLIPSGCMNHGNTPIADNETRHSITQYAAGGLFRWAAYGFQTAKALLATKVGTEAKERFDGVPGARWSWAMGLFSKVDELEGDRVAASVDT